MPDVPVTTAATAPTTTPQAAAARQDVGLPPRRFTVAYIGAEKSAKTHNWCTFPDPIEALYLDPHIETVRGFQADGKRIHLTIPQSGDPWGEFVSKWLPMARNREFPATTLVLDSYTFLAQSLDEKISGVTEQQRLQGTVPQKVSIQQWGQIKAAHHNALRLLVSTAIPRGNPGDPAYHPGYNVVVTAHLSDQYHDEKEVIQTREGPQVVTRQVLDGKRPAVSGSFKDVFGRMFGSVFYCESGVEASTDPKTKQLVRRPSWWVWTCPPNAYVQCGDSVGGKGGLAMLPAKLSGTYQSLTQAWGLKETT